MTDRDRLEELIVARHPCVWIQTNEEEYVLGMLREIAIELQRDLWLWTVSLGVRDGMLSGSPAVADTEHPAAALYYLSRTRQKPGLCVMIDLIGHLKDERTLRLLREAVQRLGESGSQIILLDHREDLPPVISAVATRFEVSFPDEKELEGVIKETLRKLNDESRIEVKLTRHDLQTIIRNLRGLSRRQARQVVFDTVCLDRKLDASDINSILARKRRAIGEGLLEYVEAPVDLEQIGGLQNLKKWLKQRNNCLSDDAAAFGLPAPRGVLMLGVQGAGKSLSAKAVATAWQRPLLRMDAGALYDRYIGESESRLRGALRQAEMMSPVILWIDEIEKGFASAASQSSDGGLSKRMFGSLLTWMQEHTAPVFLIATANDIEALPPELLRKGRFDEIFFVDLPGLEARYAILAIHLKKRNRNPARFDLDVLAGAAAGYSGAEIEQAIISALHEAFSAETELTTQHVLTALKNSPPLSVTMAEKIEALREWSQGRCVPAD